MLPVIASSLRSMHNVHLTHESHKWLNAGSPLVGRAYQ